MRPPTIPCCVPIAANHPLVCQNTEPIPRERLQSLNAALAQFIEQVILVLLVVQEDVFHESRKLFRRQK